MNDSAVELLAKFEAEIMAAIQSRQGRLAPSDLLEVIQQVATAMLDSPQSPWRQGLLTELETTRKQLRLAERVRDRAIAEREQASLAAIALLEEARAERDQAQAELRKVVRKQSRPPSTSRTGRAPFGYRVGIDHSLVPIPEQQTAIRYIRRLRADGKSLREIAGVLAESGITLSPPTIARVIKDAGRDRSPRGHAGAQS